MASWVGMLSARQEVETSVDSRLQRRRPRLLHASIWVAVFATVAVALVLVGTQPYRGHWSEYADADATYTASSLNLAAGERTRYLDHPGLPIQEALAGAFALWRGVDCVVGKCDSAHEFAGSLMLDLDRARPLYRGLAVALYLLGAAFAALLVGRWLGNGLWGFAGGLLWLGAPAMVAMSIQIRPDVLLCGLVIPIGYLVVRGYERRSGPHYLAAAALIGFATSVKMHAAGMGAALALALVLGPPSEGALAAWRAIRHALSRHRLSVGLMAGVWLAAAVYFNASRVPFSPTDSEIDLVANALLLIVAYLCVADLVRRGQADRVPVALVATILVALAVYFTLPLIPIPAKPSPLHYLAGAVVLVAAYLAAAHAVRRVGTAVLLRRVFDPFLAATAVAIAVGVALSALVVLDDGLASLVAMSRGLTGGGVNEGVARFGDWSSLTTFPLFEALIVFSLAGVGAAIGAATRDVRPLIWFTGAAALEAMAAGRLGHAHYFAPGYVAAIPAALWLVGRSRRLAIPLATALVAIAIVPLARNVHAGDSDSSATAQRSAIAAMLEVTHGRLAPHEIVLTPAWLPIPDVLYYHLVQRYVAWSPEYPYHYLPATPAGISLARSQHLTPRYAVLGVGVGGAFDLDGRYRTRAVRGTIAEAAQLVELQRQGDAPTRR